MKYFSIAILFSDSRRDIVRYKRKRVHKVLPSLSLLRKSVVRLTDHLDMAMTIDQAFNLKTKVSQNSSRGQSYLYSMVSNSSKQRSRCTPRLVNQGSCV